MAETSRPAEGALSELRRLAEAVKAAREKFEQTDSMGDALAIDHAEYDLQKVATAQTILGLLDVVEAAQRIREAMKNPDRDWLGLPPEASDEWVQGFFAALRSLDDNSYIAQAVDRLEGTS